MPASISSTHQQVYLLRLWQEFSMSLRHTKMNENL